MPKNQPLLLATQQRKVYINSSDNIFMIIYIDCLLELIKYKEKFMSKASNKALMKEIKVKRKVLATVSKKLKQDFVGLDKIIDKISD